MTTYAYDPTTTTLLATWTCGIGSAACAVARLHHRTPQRTGMHLAQALTDLSSAAWASYAAPALAELHSEPALDALRRPHLPRDGLLYREGDELLERAHEVGRALVAVESAGVLRAVVADVTAEFDTVHRALHGDLGGRARQAVTITRLPAPPAQIAAADRLLHAVPMGNERLVTDVEPTAACVAALHWTAAAVDVTLAAVGGGDPAEVLEEAADAEGVDVLAATAVLGMLHAGNPPLAVVQDLVSSAVLVGSGLDGEEFGPADRGHGPRTTLLHPSSPARALLGLLTGVVRACFTVYSEACDPAGVDGDGDWIDLTRERFDRAVRAEADRRSDRLLEGCA
jgi:hypothetical protein